MKRVAFAVPTLLIAFVLLHAATITSSRISGLGRGEGLNRSGQIVEQSVGGEATSTWIYSNGERTPVRVPGSESTVGFGIDDTGRVVGYYTESRTGHQHGFLYSQGSFSPIEVADSFATFPRGINNSGQVAGYIYRSAGTAGFIYDGGTYKLVRVPGANSTFLLGINNLGDTVGYYSDATRPHGVLYDRSGTLKVIDVPGSRSTTLNGIDSQGTIAGTFIDARQHEHAFSYTTSGVFTTIDAPGAAGKLGTVARSINDLGQILIQGSDHFLVNVAP